MSLYYYFAASLPNLQFGGASPMSSAEFLDRCRIHLAASDYSTLKSAVILSDPDLSPSSPEFSGLLLSYYSWERSLRNELAVLRARRLDRSADRWIRPTLRNDEAARAAGLVMQAENPLDGELTLERERWTYIDSLCSLHTFDLDALAAYRLKLQIIERIAGLVPERGESGYKEACAAILGGAEYSDSRGV